MRKLKKAVSLTLALVLSLALVVPAFAVEKKLKVNITFDGYLRTEYVKGDSENEFMAVQVVKDGSNVKLECPGAERLVVEDEYERSLEVESLQYTKGAGWVPGPAEPYLDGLNQDFGGVFIDASTKTFAATSTDAGSFIFVVGIPPLSTFGDDGYFDVKETYWMSESGYAQLAPEFKGTPGPGSEIIGTAGPAAGGQPTTPPQPEQPAGVKTANPTNDKLTVNGVLADPTVYKIGGSNYFKIRDVAAVLNGTGKQFAVGYAGGKVTVTSGQPYEATGKELAGAPSDSKTASPSNDTIMIDGTEASLTVYKIGGANYFKLRDLGKALNFYVGWEAGKGVYIETDKPYSE